MTSSYYLLGVIAAFYLCCADRTGFSEAPPPVDCEISSWTEWSECDPCSNLRYRSRSIVKFGQNGGKKCLSPLGEHQRCKTDKRCGDTVIDCGNDFECDSGRCIKQRLLCNGDNDCGDNSDETCDDDREPKLVCRNMDIELSEIARTAGDGFNLLGVDTKKNPFDNEFFNGMCDRVRDGNTRTYYRKPWNVAALVYQTKADKTFTTEAYEDAVNVLTKILQERTQNFDLSVNLKVTPSNRNDTTITGKAGFHFNKSESVETIKEYSKKSNKQFLRVSGTVQLGTFQMRTRGATLSPTFIEDLNNLPSFYNKGEYFAFLEMYGTHYAVSGTLGGRYELVYVLDSVALKTRDATTRTVSRCLGYDVGITVETKGINVSPGLKGDDCKKTLGHQDSDGLGAPVIDNIVSFVEGGTVDFVTLLEEQLSRKSKDIDVEHFVKWASSLVDAPVVINRKLSPIYTLVPTDLRDGYIKMRNLERAIEDYVDEYNVCKCQPCQNGGTLVLLDDECMCKCPLEYMGKACEKLKHEQLQKPPKPHVGIWSCWKPSSTCINEEETRTRTCKNPSCVGETTRKVPC